MDRNQIAYFENKLLQEKQEALDTMQRMEDNEPNDSLQEYYGELSSYDNHPADIATETYEMEMNFNLKNNVALHLEEIDAALRKVEQGSYGICDRCGKDIPEDRLEILPTARECMDCEKGGLSIELETTTRPVEEEVLYPPYERTFKDDDEDYNGFDGEDSWQAVARYNKTDQKHMALDWYDNNMYDENISGTVEDVENISEDFYRGQFHHEERKDTKFK